VAGPSAEADVAVFRGFRARPGAAAAPSFGPPRIARAKAYEVLLLLVERRPRALWRAQIRDVVWPGVFVSESTLGVVVNSVRQALGDDARQPRFVRTVHGFGYAFCGEALDSPDGPGRTSSLPTPEDSSPYPGLLAFTEADAVRFFGREVEVAALWEKLRRQKLLAVIGPSGARKTSFVRAGVIPSRPGGMGDGVRLARPESRSRAGARAHPRPGG
jgi:hypothetical protein